MSKRFLGSASLRLVVPILALANSGCGDDECGGSVAAQACCDIIDALSDTCVRCGGGTLEQCEDTIRRGLEAELGDEGCREAVRVRDRESLYDECLPELEVFACQEFRTGGIPSSCRNQILYYE